MRWTPSPFRLPHPGTVHATAIATEMEANVVHSHSQHGRLHGQAVAWEAAWVEG